MGPHVAVIDPATRVPELDCFNRMSRQAPLSLTYHLPALFGLDSLASVEEGLRGIVVLGSGASVNEDHAWLLALRAWLRPRLLGGVPTLGLCFGHQLISSLLGGEVSYVHADAHKESGARIVSMAPNRLWREGGSGPLAVSHREMVVQIPQGMEVVGSTEICPAEILLHRELPIASFQSHPEATAAFLRNNDVPWPLELEALAHGHTLVGTFLARVALGGV